MVNGMTYDDMRAVEKEMDTCPGCGEPYQECMCEVIREQKEERV